MAGHVEFFFDLSSPWTRLAFHNIQPILAETGANVRWRPFLVGGVFNAVNPSVYQARESNDPKMARSFGWLKEWAALAGLAMNFPSPYHPVKSVWAMRFCCALEDRQADLHAFAEAAFETYYRDQQNLDDSAVLVSIAQGCGLDGAALAASAQTGAIKDRLRANTQEAIDRGAFGSPTMFVAGEAMYFGNDQLPLVRAALSMVATKS
ncbi:2-hydroxychromene-2-carboxylate isomerase [Novosphingobium sp.]|uniref:2-hydroxychromene-2-carboxylate isomerase n=1 Tax=Novosphingobium sp. TaxID=1874826 RepID=UPI0025D3FC9B|nr:2-hydroxychromene-2-carboxylate isomerase [Novosphingobium sp.]